ncbi:phosphopantetheine-binding protein, partial [Xanthomonas citri pv. citri]
IAPAAPAPAVAAAPLALADIVAELRRSLAHELRLPVVEIGADEEFVALGLDSITGVTWIRRVNERYGTAIEAVQVYSHPNLARLSAFVAEKAGAAALPAEPVSMPASPPADIAANTQPNVEPARVVLTAQRHHARRTTAPTA